MYYKRGYQCGIFRKHRHINSWGGGGKCLTVKKFIDNFKKEGYNLSINGRKGNQLFPLTQIEAKAIKFIKIERISCAATNNNGWLMTYPELEYSCSQKFTQTTTIEITQSFNYTQNLGGEKQATFSFTIPANSINGTIKGTIVSQSSQKYSLTDTPNPYGLDSAQITKGDTTIDIIGIKSEDVENPSPIFQWRADYLFICDYSNVKVITDNNYDVSKWAGSITYFKGTVDEHTIDFGDDNTVFSGNTGAGSTYQAFANTISDTIAGKISMIGGMSPIAGVTEEYKDAKAYIAYNAEDTIIYESNHVRPFYSDEIACPEKTIRLKSGVSGTEQLWTPASTVMKFYIMFNFLT